MEVKHRFVSHLDFEVAQVGFEGGQIACEAGLLLESSAMARLVRAGYQQVIDRIDLESPSCICGDEHRWFIDQDCSSDRHRNLVLSILFLAN